LEKIGKNKNRRKNTVENKITIFSTHQTPIKPSFFELFLHNRKRAWEKSEMTPKRLRYPFYAIKKRHPDMRTTKWVNPPYFFMSHNYTRTSACLASSMKSIARTRMLPPSVRRMKSFWLAALA
jgi:hypothetical protein